METHSCFCCGVLFAGLFLSDEIPACNECNDELQDYEDMLDESDNADNLKYGLYDSEF